MGVDVSRFVISWGRLEQIKDILLAQATLITSELTIQVHSFKGFMKAMGPGSLVAGLDHYNALLELIKDGRTIYEGFIRDMPSNSTSGTGSIVTENVLRKPAETVISGQATGANPVLAMLFFLRQAMPERNIDARTFDQAAAQSGRARATIDYDIKQGDNVTVMQFIQQVSELSSVSVFVRDNKVIARAFKTFQGGDAGMKAELTDPIVREWGQLSFDNSSFNNSVAVGYPTDKFVLLEDSVSIKQNGGNPRKLEFPADEKITASDESSARFFGKLYLSRASKRRRKMSVAGGKELAGHTLGDRFQLTHPDQGLQRFPVEAIEVSETIDGEEVEMSVAEIFVA